MINRAIKSTLWFLAAFFLTVYAGLASAAAPVDGWRESTDYVNWYTSAQAVCDAKPSTALRTVTLVARPNFPYFGCKVVRLSDNYTEYRELWMSTAAICADGSKPDTSKPMDQRCSSPPPPPPPQCPAQTYTEKVTYVVSNDGKTIIYNPHKEGTSAINAQQCKLEIIATERCYTLPKSSNPNQSLCTFTARQSGGAGQGGEPAPVPPAAETDTERTDVPPDTGKSDGSCPKGTVNAGLSASGIPMCIGQGTDPKNAPPAPPKIEAEKNETLPDGSTKNTKTVTTTNTDLSKTTITTVTITKPSGEKETNQEKNTTKTPSGKDGKETQPDEQKGDLCKQNPNLAICKNSTVSGKCGEIACTGDAIQCATLRAAAAMQCSIQKDEESLKASPLAAKGQAAIDGKDLEGLPGPKGAQVVNLGAMKAEGWLGNGAAFEDVSFSLQGHEVVMPLSKWSSYLLPLRYVMMIIASLISYRILAGAVLKE